MATTDKDDLNAKVHKLRADTGFSILECKKALRTCADDFDAAKLWLARGHWMTAKLVSWDHKSLNENAKVLHAEIGGTETACRVLLMQCGGNLELVRWRLAVEKRAPR